MFKIKDSSHRSSGRKSGNPSEVIEAQQYDLPSCFLNRVCAIQDSRKSSTTPTRTDPFFPPLPQGLAKSLCKVDALCEKCVRGRLGQGLGIDRSFTETTSNIYSRSMDNEPPTLVAINLIPDNDCSHRTSHSSTDEEYVGSFVRPLLGTNS
jgi:hypothetical protein